MWVTITRRKRKPGDGVADVLGVGVAPRRCRWFPRPRPSPAGAEEHGAARAFQRIEAVGLHPSVGQLRRDGSWCGTGPGRHRRRALPIGAAGRGSGVQDLRGDHASILPDAAAGLRPGPRRRAPECDRGRASCRWCQGEGRGRIAPQAGKARGFPYQALAQTFWKTMTFDRRTQQASQIGAGKGHQIVGDLRQRPFLTPDRSVREGAPRRGFRSGSSPRVWATGRALDDRADKGTDLVGRSAAPAFLFSLPASSKASRTVWMNCCNWLGAMASWRSSPEPIMDSLKACSQCGDSAISGR